MLETDYRRENISTCDLANPTKKLLLSRYLSIWLCLERKELDLWPKYNVSRFRELLDTHRDSVSQKCYDFPLIMVA